MLTSNYKIAALFTVSLLISLSARAEMPMQFNPFDQLISYPDKKELPRPNLSSRSLVAVTLGQSNSANHGGQKNQNSDPRILNYSGGKFYLAADPLLGATGFSGSPWVLMAQKLIKLKLYDTVVLASYGVGSTSVARWKKGGDLYQMLTERLEDLKNQKLTVTHFLWHQGEGDNPLNLPSALSPEDYKKGMKDVIELTKNYFPTSKFFVAVATVCNYPLRPSEKLQAAQRELTKLPGVYAGPNTDLIGLEDRHDNCHFSATGLEKHADSWVSALRAVK